MRAVEIRELTTEELQSKLKNLKGELFNLRFQFTTSQLDSPMRISAIKKDIARIRTMLHDNELKDNTKV